MSKRSSISKDPQRSSISKDAPYRYLEPRRSSNLPERFIGVIDAKIDRLIFCVFSTPDFKLITKEEISITTIIPQDGWFEQDPREYLTAINKCCFRIFSHLTTIGYSNRDITTLGITNQRETIILWDRLTGDPLYNAILGKDMRSAKIIDEIITQVPGHNINYYKQICGLPLSPYFSASKISWLVQNVPAVKKACQDGHCLAGTVDSWIIWNLSKGSLHITDVTNAAHTLLMNIHTRNWDRQLLQAFSIDISILPEIRSSSEIYGRVYDVTSEFYGMRISGILGNPQASLLGQLCIKPGDTNNTYNSSCSLLCNTGSKCLVSKHGLLTTIAYQLGPKAPIVYALEGAVAIAGQALDWLHRNVRIVPDLTKVTSLASAVNPSRGGTVYFVPSFTGLYSPYWRPDARGVICGITDFTTKNHIVLAALEAICYQVHDILECEHIEGVFKLRTLYTDGELAANDFLMQLQADLGGITVLRSQVQETAALGVAICAAQADGISLFEFASGIEATNKTTFDEFSPKTLYTERKRRYTKWRRATQFSMGWAIEDSPVCQSSKVESSGLSQSKKAKVQNNENYNFVNAIPVSLYIVISTLMVFHIFFRSVIK